MSWHISPCKLLNAKLLPCELNDYKKNNKLNRHISVSQSIDLSDRGVVCSDRGVVLSTRDLFIIKRSKLFSYYLYDTLKNHNIPSSFNPIEWNLRLDTGGIKLNEVFRSLPFPWALHASYSFR